MNQAQRERRRVSAYGKNVIKDNIEIIKNYHGKKED